MSRLATLLGDAELQEGLGVGDAFGLNVEEAVASLVDEFKRSCDRERPAV